MRIIILLCILTISLQVKSANVKDYLTPIPKEVKSTGNHLSASHLFINTNNLSTQLNGPLLKTLNSFSQTGINGHFHPLSFGIDYGTLTCNINPTYKTQAYKLIISQHHISITGGSNTALYYGLITLQQIGKYAQHEGYWPCLEINDEPSFRRRGVMLDISRDKVPSMQTLYSIIDQLAQWKINEIQLYTEHTFAYKNHQTVWENSSPITAEEIISLDKYCQDRFIDLVPNQNSFGHMKRWLKHKEYEHLAELPKPGKTIWGMMSRTSLSPIEPGSFQLMQELYTELLPNFSSTYFNIGCDETVELGVGKSKNLCQQIGKGRVYLDFVLKLKHEVDKHDKTTQFWGDIILHHPELIPELPKDMVALIWGYEANYPFNKHCQQFKNAGLPYYVCPGTSTWNSIIGRNNNGFANLKNAAINGEKHNATGYLNTNWGDQGHWQPLSVCYPGLLYGAALSWNVENNKTINIGQHLSIQLYNNTSGIAGDAIVNIGNAYLKMDAITDNSSIFHQLLKRNRKSIKTDRWLKRVNQQNTEQTIKYIQQELNRLNSTTLHCPDSAIVKLEMTQACRLALHACNVAIAKLETNDGSFNSIQTETKKDLRYELTHIIEQHRAIWLKRNRIGGLDDSANKMTRVLDSYK